MTNFAIGAIFGFLACVWAIQSTPSHAFVALWTRLEEVQEASAAANKAYDAINYVRRDREKPAEPLPDVGDVVGEQPSK